MNRLPVVPAMVALCAAVLLTGCVNASRHHEDLASSREQELTLGTVQRSIREGMPQSAVVSALGSPNLVTRDLDGTETWVYDKVSTDRSYQSSSKSFRGLVAGGGSSVEGAVSGDYAKQAGASSSSQRTLTVIIRFAAGMVSDYAWQSSRF